MLKDKSFFVRIFSLTKKVNDLSSVMCRQYVFTVHL